MNQTKKPSRFPWYDSGWLQAYVQAKATLRSLDQSHLRAFENEIERLQVSPDFDVHKLSNVLDTNTHKGIKRLIDGLSPDMLEKHELRQFGRMVVHDHPQLAQLHVSLAATVGDIVGEKVEPSYNFLSLYNNLGICKVHMDAPSAKWTLDICIEQSGPWPMYISQVTSWPEDFTKHKSDWHAQILESPGLTFSQFEFNENEGLIFAGGNQWHYRNRIKLGHSTNFCHLLFLHFRPIGTEKLVDPRKWVEYFNIPELINIC